MYIIIIMAEQNLACCYINVLHRVHLVNAAGKPSNLPSNFLLLFVCVCVFLQPSDIRQTQNK